MDVRDEARTLRRRLQDIEYVADGSVADQPSNAVAVVGRTTAIEDYPTVAGSYYAMFPVRITGQLKEGVVPTLTAGTKAFLALNLGTGIPPSGSDHVVNGDGGRFTFRYDG